ncbi:MAG: DUF4376 domain-containing protein [Gallionellaceae bacterium]|jgi:hypothetical protein
MTPWKYSADGASASRTLDNGSIESRRVSAIPASELATAIPADPPTLTDMQATRIALMEAEYQAAITAPVVYMSTTFQADRDSQILLDQAISIYTRQGMTPAGFWWKDAANVHVAMTLAQLQGFGDAIASRVWSSFQTLDARKAAIRAATTVAQVQGVVW